MKLIGKTILVTGGSEGIGFELARQLLADNDVIVCGRSQAKLERAKLELPGLHTRVCDLTNADQRVQLCRAFGSELPDLDILINNAGGRQRIDMLNADPAEHALAMERDLDLGFRAPVAMCTQMLDPLRRRPKAMIVNVTTGLVFLPKIAQPYYCAAKTALHSYTRSLRYAVQNLPITIQEAILPVVRTNFHRGSPPAQRAISAAQAASEMIAGMERESAEVFVGHTRFARWLATIAPQRCLGIVNR